MGNAYSNDLRIKLLEAHERGEGSLSQLAKRFSVSVGWAEKISGQFLHTGSMERPTGRRRGPACKITPEIQEELKKWIRQQSDLTLAELQRRVYEKRQVEISITRLWGVLKSLGLRLKKSHSTLRSKTPRPVNSDALAGVKPAKGSMRRT